MNEEWRKRSFGRLGEVGGEVAFGAAVGDAEECGMDFEGGQFGSETGLSEGLACARAVGIVG